MEEQQPLDAIGYAIAGHGAAADIDYVGTDLKRVGCSLANELVAPLQLLDLITPRFPVFDDLKLAQRAVGMQTDSVGNQLMLANDLIDDEPTEQFTASHRFPYELFGRARLDARLDFEQLHLLRRQFNSVGNKLLSLGEDEPAGLVDRHVLGGDALGRGGGKNGNG